MKANSIQKFKCENCGENFSSSRAWTRFCSDKCRNSFHNDKKATQPTILVIKCPNCDTDSSMKDMIELIHGKTYLCNCCAREFVIRIESS